jgi:hypothetical protein
MLLYYKRTEVLERSNRLLFFHYNLSIWHNKQKKSALHMSKEINKTIQFEGLQCWYYWWEWIMQFAVEMMTGGMIYMPSCMMIGSGIQVILKLMPKPFDTLLCLHYWWEVLMKYAVVTAADSMIHIPSFKKSVLAFRNYWVGYIYRHTHTQNKLISEPNLTCFSN